MTARSSTDLMELARLANSISGVTFAGGNFPKVVSWHLEELKQAFVLADTLPSSGTFTAEVWDYPSAGETVVTSDQIRLVQGLVGLELRQSEYESTISGFPKNAQKKLAKAIAFIGRELQILISYEVAPEE